MFAFYAENTDAFQVDFTSVERGSAAASSVTNRKDLEVLDLLVVAQGEHERPGITLTVPQQE